MGRATILLPGLCLVLVGAGCSSLESGGRPHDDDAEAVAVARASAPAERGWTGAKARSYERSYRICSVFSVQELATELGVRKRPKAAALAHARANYDPQFRRAAYEGCLDAFRGRAPAG